MALPNLDRLALVPTGGMLGNAQWPEDEVCSICTFPLARPSEDERCAWPFAGDGGGFTAVACVQGHAFHKGCLRFMQRFDDTRCPDCRKPMFQEVLKDATRPSPEELERQRRQEEERARAREEREREAEERIEEERRRINDAPTPQIIEYEETPAIDDHVVQWTFFVKGHVRINRATWSATRAFFGRQMRREWAPANPVEDWRRRLGIRVFHENATPTDMPAQLHSLAFTRCRFRVHLPAAVARRFGERLVNWIGDPGYARAMDNVLGIRTAKQAGQAIAVMAGWFGENTDETTMRIHSQEYADLSMRWQEYQQWPPFQQRPMRRPAAPLDPPAPAPAPAPAVAPARREAVADPIATFRPPGGADTDVTIRWRFWLKGPMSESERSTAPTIWRRDFANLMRDAPGMESVADALRTSADPWHDRLWAWIQAEEPSVTGPRPGPAFLPRVIQRCEFALRLPRALSSAWLAAVAREFDLDNWNRTAQAWFYVEPARSIESRDGPHVALPGDTLHPLVESPRTTQEAYNAWEPWWGIPRYRAIGEARD